MVTKTTQSVSVEGRTIDVTNLEKMIWPKEQVTKADLIHYIFMVSHLMLEHLRNRPLTVTRYPDGVEQEGFYQKDCPDYAPEWISTYPVLSPEGEKVTRYILANDTPTLIWLANQAAIEFHPWMSQTDSPQFPDYVVIDLDPNDGVTFDEVRHVATLVHAALEELGLQSFPKLSGATGIHIYVPVEPRYTYKETSGFAGFIGELAAKALPHTATNERLVRNRGRRVYVDHLQNLPGKTIVSAYSPRPRAGAQVSVPFEWNELDSIDPRAFSIKSLDSVLARPQTFQRMYSVRQSLDHVRHRFEHRLRK